MNQPKPLANVFNQSVLITLRKLVNHTEVSEYIIKDSFEFMKIKKYDYNRLFELGLLFSAPGLGNYISGAILYEETLYQSSKEGKTFVSLLKENGVFPGIKVDTGLQPLPGADPIETW